MKRTLSLATAFLALSSAPALAQSTAVEVEQVLAAVDRLFDGMRAGDTTAIRSVLHPSAALVATGTRDGAPSVQVVPIDRFLAGVAAGGGELDERIWDPVVQLRDNLATVWTKYAFYLDGELSHCGVDAFTLVRTADGWKIAHIADTRQQEECEEPPG